MSNEKTKILAAFSTIKSIAETQQYQNAYQLLAEFIRYIVVKKNILSFTASEMKKLLLENFGFDIPEAVVRTATKKQVFISMNNGEFFVDKTKAGSILSFEETQLISEQKNEEIIERLITYAKEKNPSSVIAVDDLTEGLVKVILDEQSDSMESEQINLISEFILKNSDDEKMQAAMSAIKEGSLLYIGLNYNISETGSLKKPLTLFLSTEELFSIFGFNGEIYKKLAEDLLIQVKKANIKEKRIKLRYFTEVRREIEDFFHVAEMIADGKKPLEKEKTAMRFILKGCANSVDVRTKKADFEYYIANTCGIEEDDYNDYYAEANNCYNLECIEDDAELTDSTRLISHINKLRSGNSTGNILDARFLIVSESKNMLKASKIQTERLKSDTNSGAIADFAVSVDWITNLLWYKLGNSFGGREFPNNVNMLLKSRAVLASQISQKASKLYDETIEKCKSKVISVEQCAVRVSELKKYLVTPEDIDVITLDSLMELSEETLIRVEEEVNTNREKIEKQNEYISLMEKENEEKDKKLEQKDSENARLKEELAHFEAKEEKKRKIKKNCRTFGKWAIISAICIGVLFFVLKTINPEIERGVCFFGSIVGILGGAHDVIVKKNSTTNDSL